MPLVNVNECRSSLSGSTNIRSKSGYVAGKVLDGASMAPAAPGEAGWNGY
jgi:hypothetical protein